MLTIDIQIRVNWGNRRHSDKAERGQVKKGKKRESRLFFDLMERERERFSVWGATVRPPITGRR